MNCGAQCIGMELVCLEQFKRLDTCICADVAWELFSEFLFKHGDGFCHIQRCHRDRWHVPGTGKGCMCKFRSLDDREQDVAFRFTEYVLQDINTRHFAFEQRIHLTTLANIQFGFSTDACCCQHAMQ